MIAVALLLQAAAAGPPVLAWLGKQELPARGCAVFLWSPVDQRLIAMARGEAATLRIAVEGRPADLPRFEQHGDGCYGLAATTVYRAGSLVATLDLTFATRSDLTDGALVPQATLRLDRPGQDTLVMPLSGLVGCRKPAA